MARGHAVDADEGLAHILSPCRRAAGRPAHGAPATRPPPAARAGAVARDGIGRGEDTISAIFVGRRTDGQTTVHVNVFESWWVRPPES